MKTEKEKMLDGEIYDCGDVELISRWHEAKRLQNSYNQTDTRDQEGLNALLDKLLGSRGQNIWIAAPFFVDYGENIYIGNNVEIENAHPHQLIPGIAGLFLRLDVDIKQTSLHIGEINGIRSVFHQITEALFTLGQGLFMLPAR